MNIFDKICAVEAFVMSALLVVLGVIGLFSGCNTHFSLPPILGVIPVFVGWEIVKPIIVAWNKPKEDTTRSLCHSSPDEYDFISDQKPPGKI